MRLAKRFEILGDPTKFEMEFQREAVQVIAEADRRLALGRATKALRTARDRAERNGLGLVQRTTGASDLERWGSLASAVYWVEQLERQLEKGANSPRPGAAKAPPAPADAPSAESSLGLTAVPGAVAVEFDTPGHRSVVDLSPDDARAFAIDLIVAASEASRMAVDEPKRLH